MKILRIAIPAFVFLLLCGYLFAGQMPNGDQRVAGYRVTPIPSVTPTLSRTPSYTPTPVYTNTPSYTNTPVYTDTPTFTPTPTSTIPDGTETVTFTSTETYTDTPVFTATDTYTATPVYTDTPTYTPTPHAATNAGMDGFYTATFDALSSGVTIFFPYIAPSWGIQFDIDVAQSTPQTIFALPQVGWDITNTSYAYGFPIAANQKNVNGYAGMPVNAVVLSPRITPTTTETIKAKISLNRAPY